jgi:hypothetical protein
MPKDKPKLPSSHKQRTPLELNEALRRARALLRSYIPKGQNLSPELIAERREEAAREEIS